jgi:hypothetical protein
MYFFCSCAEEFSWVASTDGLSVVEALSFSELIGLLMVAFIGVAVVLGAVFPRS